MSGADDGGRIGTPAARVGGYERVTGVQRYVGDIRLDEVLHVKLVHLDVAHARIVSIDAEAARRANGVAAVLTAAELPQPMPRFGPNEQDRPILGVGETKFHGEPVAAVVAESVSEAEAAVDLVRVEYEELPAIFTVAAALDPASPLVQEPDLRPNDPLRTTNILQEWHYGWGDVDAARADRVVDHVYTFPMVTHFAIEPHTYMAAPERDGVAVWSPIQHPYYLQRLMARVLDLPLARVRVIAPDPGGGFGGKQHAKFEPLVAYLALRLGRPVRLALTLEETFQAVRRLSSRIRMHTGFTNDGRITFHDVESDFLIGAYADIASRVAGKSNYFACGPYRVPDARIHVRALLSHTTPATAFRGFGSPQVTWALESQVDEAARQLGIDRVEIRLRNLARKGEEIVRGDAPADGEWAEVVRKAAAWIGWGTPLPPGRGRGLAVGIKASATTGASYSIVRLLYDGSVVVLAGTSDMGQGARTVLAQIAGEELGVPLDHVSIVMGDTAVVPYDMQTSASRSTVFMGTAVQRACHEIKAQLRTMAAAAYGLAEADVSVANGTIALPDRSVGFAELLREGLGQVRGEVIGVGSRRAEPVPGHPLGGPAAFYEFSCTASEVEVDEETGELLLRRHVTVADVGRALNPQHVEMQDEGAAIMGLGHTLMEHLILDEGGRILNLGALDYRIPTTKDVPVEMDSLLVENGDGPGPYGAKGVGEGGLIPTAPAVAAAVSEATGVVIRDLPLTPERVWRALRDRDASAASAMGTPPRSPSRRR